MENFLVGWALVAMGLLFVIGLNNIIAEMYGGKTFMAFVDSKWRQARWFFWPFLIVPVALLILFFK